MNVEVAVPSILDRPLTYLWPFDISPKVGQLVEVPLKNSVTMGVIWSLTSNPVNSTHILKKILNYYPLVLPNHFIGFLKKFLLRS